MKKLLYILPIFILFSCSVQKRKYQKGFYVSATKHKKTVQGNKSVTDNSLVESEHLVLKPFLNLPESNTTVELYASSANKLSSQKTILPKLRGIAVPDSLCDIITLKNGDEVKAKVLEITSTEIKYQKCDMPDGPLYIVKKSDVFMVKYSNGTKEVFKTDPITSTQNQNTNQNKRNNDNYNGPKRTHPLAIWALVALILGLFTFGIGFIVAYFLAKEAMKKIIENPKIYKGYKLAKIVKSIVSTVFYFLLTTIIIDLFLYMLSH